MGSHSVQVAEATSTHGLHRRGGGVWLRVSMSTDVRSALTDEHQRDVTAPNSANSKLTVNNAPPLYRPSFVQL